MLTAIIRRTIPGGKEKEVMTIISELRSRAALTTGYLSSEVIFNLENEQEYVSLTKWRNIAAWKSWRESKATQDLQKKIDALGVATTYGVYGIPLDEFMPDFPLGATTRDTDEELRKMSPRA
ncbi:MAG: antibiotic biosynthesis monooxygenase family protein [Smithellaceae bacterium]